MLINSGYALGYDLDYVDGKQDFSVASCGHYQLVSRERMFTSRPQGRADFQILYVHQGQALYEVQNQRVQAPAGSLILYCPGQPQYMEYRLKNQPDVYWMHFSGTRAQELLDQLGFAGACLHPVGRNQVYSGLFDQIIAELQLKPPYYPQAAAGLGRQLLVKMARELPQSKAQQRIGDQWVVQIVQEINENYARQFDIEVLAAQCALSVSGFIKKFKHCTGSTPNQYIIQTRMNKAAELLCNTDYTVGEISLLVGYENGLYFSRLFHKKMKMPPSDYRKNSSSGRQSR